MSHMSRCTTNRISDRFSIDITGVNRDKHGSAWVSAFEFKLLSAKCVASLRYGITDAYSISKVDRYSIMALDDR